MNGRLFALIREQPGQIFAHIGINLSKPDILLLLVHDDYKNIFSYVQIYEYVCSSLHVLVG